MAATMRPLSFALYCFRLPVKTALFVAQAAELQCFFARCFNSIVLELIDTHTVVQCTMYSTRVTYEAEEADAVDTRATAAEKAHDGKDEAEDNEGDRYLINDDDRLGLVVDEQRPQSQRLTPHMKPDTARYQRPPADLQCTMSFVNTLATSRIDEYRTVVEKHIKTTKYNAKTT